MQGRYCAGGDVTQTIFELGPRYTGAQIFSKSDGPCTGTSTSGWADRYLYLVGAEIPPSAFVAAKTEIE